GGESHRTFMWDDPSGEPGATAEFKAAGYEFEQLVGLIAQLDELQAHPRENRDVEILTLDPHADDLLWEASIELQVATRDAGHEETEYRRFIQARTRDRRERFQRGDGAWFVARTPEGELVASC